MRYTYRCDACRLTWDAHDDIYLARSDQKQHMYRAHEGARPDGQIIETPGPLDQLGSAAWAVVSSVAQLIVRGVVRGIRSKSFREAQQTEWFRQAAMLLGGGVLLMVFVRWLTH
ncbi:hypothetical protein ACFVT1_36465 [Streptomyces sp. NPDC057963]|uniref:hypothetical protein n=1 Tax=Streptomyces sp. NPDC057963 TaxID=3346290 RepID=UPI0036EFCF77